jgi:hypothetical protein
MSQQPLVRTLQGPAERGGQRENRGSALVEAMRPLKSRAGVVSVSSSVPEASGYRPTEWIRLRKLKGDQQYESCSSTTPYERIERTQSQAGLSTCSSACLERRADPVLASRSATAAKAVDGFNWVKRHFLEPGGAGRTKSPPCRGLTSTLGHSLPAAGSSIARANYSIPHSDSRGANHPCIQHRATGAPSGRSDQDDRQPLVLRGSPCRGRAQLSFVRLASERYEAPRGRAQQSFLESAQGSSCLFSLECCSFGGRRPANAPARFGLAGPLAIGWSKPDFGVGRLPASFNHFGQCTHQPRDKIPCPLVQHVSGVAGNEGDVLYGNEGTFENVGFPCAGGRRNAVCARTDPRPSGAPIMAVGLTRSGSVGRRLESQSTTFSITPGIVWLYSGVASIRASAEVTRVLGRTSKTRSLTLPR